MLPLGLALALLILAALVAAGWVLHRRRSRPSAELRRFADTEVPTAATTAAAASGSRSRTAAALAAAPAPEEGGEPPARRLLGRYRIDGDIGRGGMSEVLRGYDEARGRQVAIKALQLGRNFRAADLGEARARFFREAELAERLDHPGIVRVFEVGEDAGIAFLAMELLNGRDLSAHTRPGALLPVLDVLRIGQRVAEALAYAHRQGVTHRDVKPANIMVDRARDQVKLTDFGVAHLSDATATQTGTVLGTPYFMAPEQMAGAPVDGRSDIYALGVSLFQLLSGHLPHEGSSMAELVRSIASQPAPDLRSRRPELPEVLAQVVALALEKRPETRYADAQHLADDLGTLADALEQGREAPPGAWSARMAPHVTAGGELPASEAP